MLGLICMFIVVGVAGEVTQGGSGLAWDLSG